MEAILGEKIEIPERLACLENRKKEADVLSKYFLPFKKWLLDTLS